jgi:hypothetical protein
MADQIMADSELGGTKQSLIASLVQKELAFRAMLTPFFTDVSVYANPGMKQISFPKLSSFTVQNRTEGQKGETQILTSSNDDLLLNYNAYVSWIIDAMTLKQVNIAAQLESAKRAAAAQARYVDTQIISELANVCSYFINTGADTNVTYANTVTLAQKIEEAHQNLSDCVWIVSPLQKGTMMGLDEFKRADIYGMGNIPKGVIGYVHGAPVMVHSGLASKQLFLAHKEALAFGFQKNAEYGEQDAIEYGVGAKRAAIDQLFGVKGLQIAQLSASAGKSPLVVGLND